MSDFINKTTKLHKLVIENNLTHEDILELSMWAEKQKTASTWEKLSNKYANEINKILNSKYKTGFTTRTQFHIALGESPAITKENIDLFFSRISTQKEAKSSKELDAKLVKLNLLETQIENLKNIEIPEFNDYKNLISENEKNIETKGGESKLFEFLRLNSFLQEFRSSVIKGVVDLTTNMSISQIENVLRDYDSRSDLEKISDKLSDLTGSSGKGGSLIAKVERLFKLGNSLEPSLNAEIATMHFYNSLALAMIIFYMEDKKMRYFEIYESFEKLGAFDNSWQKNVASKLESIDERLSSLSNQLTELNENFTQLSKNSESLLSDLKESMKGINSRLDANNLISGIQAYQLYKINKNTKDLRN